MDIKSQMVFVSADKQCQAFRPNPFAKTGAVARMCQDCVRDIQQHKAECVTEKDVMRALEADAKVPSVVLGQPGSASLMLGGFQAAMNFQMFEQTGTKLVINAAGLGLYAHFPKMAKVVSKYTAAGIASILFEWVDASNQPIPFEDVSKAVQAIESTVKNNGSVLVHCAQGKSRSSTVVIAYIMWKQKCGFDQAYAFVRSKRQQAEPNEGFQQALKDMTDQIHAIAA